MGSGCRPLSRLKFFSAQTLSNSLVGPQDGVSCLSSIGFQCWKQLFTIAGPRIVIHNKLLKIHSERDATSGQDQWSYCGRYWTAWSKELDYAFGCRNSKSALQRLPSWSAYLRSTAGPQVAVVPRDVANCACHFCIASGSLNLNSEKQPRKRSIWPELFVGVCKPF